MITLDQALDSTKHLSLAEKEILIDLLKKQTIEERRHEIAREVKESQILYSTGKLNLSNSTQVLDELHSSLTEPD
jgi:hypothetical protein